MTDLDNLIDDTVPVLAPSVARELSWTSTGKSNPFTTSSKDIFINNKVSPVVPVKKPLNDDKTRHNHVSFPTTKLLLIIKCCVDGGYNAQASTLEYTILQRTQEIAGRNQEAFKFKRHRN